MDWGRQKQKRLEMVAIAKQEPAYRASNRKRRPPTPDATRPISKRDWNARFYEWRRAWSVVVIDDEFGYVGSAVSTGAVRHMVGEPFQLCTGGKRDLQRMLGFPQMHSSTGPFVRSLAIARVLISVYPYHGEIPCDAATGVKLQGGVWACSRCAAVA